MSSARLGPSRGRTGGQCGPRLGKASSLAGAAMGRGHSRVGGHSRDDSPTLARSLCLRFSPGSTSTPEAHSPPGSLGAVQLTLSPGLGSLSLSFGEVWKACHAVSQPEHRAPSFPRLAHKGRPLYLPCPSAEMLRLSPPRPAPSLPAPVLVHQHPVLYHRDPPCDPDVPRPLQHSQAASAFLSPRACSVFLVSPPLQWLSPPPSPHCPRPSRH